MTERRSHSRATGSWPNERTIHAAQQGDSRAITTLVCGSHAHVRRIRRSRITLRRPVSTALVEASAEDTALARLEIERIVDSISALPADQRAVVVLRDIQGLSGAATARALNLSRAAMKSRLHRGRHALRSQLTAPHKTTSEGDIDDART